MLFQNCIGIDIRDDHISILHLRTSLKGILLAGHHFQPLNADDDLSRRLEDAAGVVAAFLRRGNIKVPEIFISVPNDLVFQRSVELPAAVSENLIQSITYELDKYIPLPANEVYLDARVISENKKTARLTALLTAARKKDLDPYITFGRTIGRGAGGIEIAASALTNFLTFHSEEAANHPFLYAIRNGESLDVGLIRDGRMVYSKTFALDESGTDPLETLQSEIKRVSERFHLDGDDLHVAADGLQLDAGSVETQGTDSGIQVRIAEFPAGSLPNRHFAAAHGLALKGLKKLPMQMNLMPVELRKKPSKLGYYMMMGLAVAILAAAAAWGGVHMLQQRVLANRIDDRLASLKAEVARINDLESEVSTLEDQIDRLVRIHQNYTPVLSVVRELTEVIPENAWVNTLTLSENDIRISGSADSATDLVTVLDASPLFSDVAFLSTITKDKKGRENFRIGMKTGD